MGISFKFRVFLRALQPLRAGGLQVLGLVFGRLYGWAFVGDETVFISPSKGLWHIAEFVDGVGGFSVRD